MSGLGILLYMAIVKKIDFSIPNMWKETRLYNNSLFSYMYSITHVI
jgi:hypothetical protein